MKRLSMGNFTSYNFSNEDKVETITNKKESFNDLKIEEGVVFVVVFRLG